MNLIPIFANAVTSDPNVLGWMRGSPPQENKIIRFSDGDFFNFPKSRWSVCHMEELMPTKRVSRGLGAPVVLDDQFAKEINELTFYPIGENKPMSWKKSLKANYTDGLIVLHEGKIIYEYYDGCLTRAGRHAVMSVSKSFSGLLAEILIQEGRLDESALVSKYVPELKQSAFGDATVRQVMDMTTALDYSEDYSDPNAGVWLHAAAGNPLPKPKDYTGPKTYYEFLQTVKKKGRHGEGFGYKTVNTDVLGWIISRVANESLTDLLSDKLWSRIGLEQDAYYSVDSIGTPFAGGGLNMSLMDLARVGDLLLNDGVFKNQQIIPLKAIQNIRKGSSQHLFKAGGHKLLPNWSYRSMWWVSHNEHGAFMARGVHGQSLYIDPTAKMVIARFASHPQSANAYNDPTTLPAFHALARKMLKKK